MATKSPITDFFAKFSIPFGERMDAGTANHSTCCRVCTL